MFLAAGPVMAVPCGAVGDGGGRCFWGWWGDGWLLLFRVNDTQAEVLFEGVEVAVPVEQRMCMFEAEGRDQAVDGFADGTALERRMR